MEKHARTKGLHLRRLTRRNVLNNYFKGLPYPAIWKYSGTLSKVLIEGNVIEKCRSPGISANGAILRNNKII